MTKRNLVATGVFIITLLFTGGLQAQNWKTITGSGSVVKKDFNLAAFDGFTLGISAKVYLRQGNTQSVSIEAQQNIMDLLLTEVNDKHWKIRFESGVNVRKYQPIRIYITIPTLTKAHITGSGDVIGEGTFTNLSNLSINITGSGDLKLAVEAQDIEGKITGSGNVKLDGSANALTISITGSGDFLAAGLSVKNSTVRISGSGDCTTNVSDTIDIQVSGSGNVRYKGQPKVNAKVSGSGSVRAI